MRWEGSVLGKRVRKVAREGPVVESPPPVPVLSRSVGKHMDLIPAINTYMPLLLVAIVGLVICNAFEKFMGLLGIDVKGSPVKGNVEDEEKIREGRALIRRGVYGGACVPARVGNVSSGAVSDPCCSWGFFCLWLVQLAKVQVRVPRGLEPPLGTSCLTHQG